MGGILEIAAVAEIASDVAVVGEVATAAEVGLDAATIASTVGEAAATVGESFGIGGEAAADIGASTIADTAPSEALATSDLAAAPDSVAASNTGATIGEGPGITGPTTEATNMSTTVGDAGIGQTTPVANNGATLTAQPASATPVTGPNPGAGTVIDTNAPAVTGGDPALSQPQGIGSPGPVTSDPALSQPIGMDPAGGPGGATPPGTNGGGVMDWLKANQGAATLGGGLINGVGTGISGMAGASSKIQAEQIAAQNAQTLQGNQQGFVTGNYNTTGGLLNPTSATVPGNPTPAQRFDVRAYGGEYQYDAASGRIKFIKNSGPQPIGAPTTATPGAGATA